MICLDTNYLIKGLEEGSTEAARIVEWYQCGEPLITAMPSWYEFVCGPLSESQEATMRAFVQEIVPFDEEQARAAAFLFNQSGRRRHLRVDAMIAGCAMVRRAKMATDNLKDFRVFKEWGLELVED